MPELPEVETVKRGLQPVMEGAVIDCVNLRRPDLRFPFPSGLGERMAGETITALGRRAKYLLISLSNGRVAVSHLGMSGSWRIENVKDEAGTLAKLYHERAILTVHDHIVIDLTGRDGQSYRVIYNDPRRFGFFFDEASNELPFTKHFAGLGVEPTGNALTADYLAGAFADKSTSLKAALLDQRIIAGLGNIYVCEALWRSGLSPRRAASTLVKKNGKATARLQALTGHIRDVIAEAIEAGGSSLRDHRQADGSLGYFQHNFSAYDQADEPCKRETCDGTIKRIVQNGRSTFYCSTCQR
ncbi:MAG: bifunctional DNA-formamidopyrimidine glycosylase/DNA-(apurinic or apyrimidinic site) lyase [Pseudomonadota bacterium]